MTTLAKPKSVNNMESVRPGLVGSVGDALIWGQLAKSTPDSPINWDPTFYGRTLNGSLTTPQPYVYDSAWNMGRHEQTAYGLIQQDLRAPDKLHEPTVFGGNPNYSWNNKVATVYEAKVRGNKFLPLPGRYQLSPGEVPRGTQIVRSTDIDGTFSADDMSPPTNIFGKVPVVPAPKGVLESIVTKRPTSNAVNQSKNFTFMAPKSGFGTSEKYK